MYITAHEVSLGGESLRDIDDRIIVNGISCDAAKYTESAATAFGRPGQRRAGRHRDYMDVTVNFSIRVKKTDMAERAAVWEQVMTWAARAWNGAWLTSEQREGRRIWVTVQQLPAEGDQWEWATVYSIVFRSMGIAAWQDARAISLTAENHTSGTKALRVSGNDRTVMNFTYLNTSGNTCDTITISTGTAEMQFSGLGILAGETFQISHTEEGLLRIRICSTGGVWRSAMGARIANGTYQSADDLWISPGAQSVTVTAERAGTITMESCGRWL